MNAGTVIKNVHKHINIVFYPIAFDVLTFLLGWYFIGHNIEHRFSIRLLLEMGMPSLSQISNDGQWLNHQDFTQQLPNMPTYIWSLFFLFLLIKAFLQGGYIRYLYAIVSNEDFTFQEFLRSGRKNWVQFILLEIIIFLLKIFIATFLSMIFHPVIVLFATLASLFVLRIFFLFLEFSLVVDRVNIPVAMKKARKSLGNVLPQAIFALVLMYSISLPFSFLYHWFYSPGVTLLMIVLYAYVMTLIQAVWMLIYCIGSRKLHRDKLT